MSEREDGGVSDGDGRKMKRFVCMFDFCYSYRCTSVVVVKDCVPARAHPTLRRNTSLKMK